MQSARCVLSGRCRQFSEVFHKIRISTNNQLLKMYRLTIQKPFCAFIALVNKRGGRNDEKMLR